MTSRARRPRRPDPDRARARFDPLPDWAGPSTRLVHAARRPERNAGAVVPPIYQTTTFHFPADFSEAAPENVRLYTRDLNPSQEVAAEIVRQLEGGEEARVFASGMGAISASILALVRPGEEVVTLDTLYGGTLDLFTNLLPRLGVKVRWVSRAEALRPEDVIARSTRLAYLETPTNPRLNVVDIRHWAEVAHAAKAPLLVDSTFATPINQRPLDLGADLVLHSATKYLGGHADLSAGAAVGSAETMRAIDSTRRVLGPVLDPLAAFLLARGLRTLALRVARQNENGRVVSGALAQHPAVESVHYPGRESAEEERIAASQMRGRGGMLSVALHGGAEAADRFVRKLRFAHVASSLGGVETLVSVPALTSHRHLSVEDRERRGIPEGLVRISLGIEEPEDLRRDFLEALGGS